MDRGAVAHQAASGCVMGEAHTRLGEVLVNAGLLDREMLAAARTTQAQHKLRLIEVLISYHHIPEVQITQTISNQLSVAWVSLDHVQFTPELLRWVPEGLPVRHGLLPVHFRRDEQSREILYVAMADPTDVQAMRDVSAYANTNVRPMIATPSELRRAIRTHYGEPSDPGGQRAPHPPFLL